MIFSFSGWVGKVNEFSASVMCTAVRAQLGTDVCVCTAVRAQLGTVVRL